MGSQPGAHRSITRLLSSAMIVMGIVLVIRALSEGGGPLSTGVIVGILFTAAGAGRLWLTMRSG
jgi:hypothetical protein